MKRLFNKKRPDLFWSIVCLLAMMMSCSSEVEPAGIENSEPLTDNETLSEELCDFDTIPANETALEYFDLLKTVILADDANNSSTVTVIPDTPETAAEAAFAEMPIAKWLAPQKFICTTLAWYCVKKLKDINLTSWYSTMPTPSDILLNENIYIKFNIK